MFKLQSKITLFTTGQMDYESVWVQFLLTPPHIQTIYEATRLERIKSELTNINFLLALSLHPLTS